MRPAESASRSDPARAAERAAERRALRNAAIACLVIALGVYVINSLSIMTVIERGGGLRPAWYPWVLEGTAVIGLLAGLPVIVWFGHRFAFEPGRWRTSLAVHLAGALIYGAIQIAIMLGLRAALWPVLFAEAYVYGDAPFDIALYEFRKQAGIYAGFQAVVWVARHIERLRMDAAAAHADARAAQRVTLKCGGRTFHLDAGDFVAAKAAGNYVEARFGPREHLARMTLSELAALLREADIDVARVHRSWLVNRAAIAETAPDGQGGLVITLADGTTIPGSRRYRAAGDAAGS
ncbi:hypothetical protein DDZ18_01515 [Marinicauda salina]|uniref:HTH LytTR-type domain-containing protein n=1 Tax=Marinicauda salina TaxID=2135793 RepID=A0A2U2BWB7_9PROT|nr:LytTR family DNA-binding domain-containing protein [Marinicauda salina]PWE18311.1 hypothetical protein DDZ18_01515 [Marinicauda salina]